MLKVISLFVVSVTIFTSTMIQAKELVPTVATEPTEAVASATDQAKLNEDKMWEYRINLNTLYILAGSLSTELEFSPGKQWTQSIGLYYISTVLLDSSLTGVSYRWNYYTNLSPSMNSWVFAVGASLVKGEFFGFESISIAPELHAGYKWNFNPFSLFAGAGFGVANAGLIIQLGYSF